MDLNELKGIVSDISEDFLKEKGINSISWITLIGFDPRMNIKYKDGVIETIDDVNEIEKFIQTLQK